VGSLALGTKSVACWVTMENFDFGTNICHKGKGDGVGNRRGRKQVTIVGVVNKRGKEGGVGSRARKEKGKRQLRHQQKRIAVAAGKTTLNFLITGMTFEEILLSCLGILEG